VILALVARIDPAHPKIPASDQWLTVGCALENMLLAAQSLGFAVAVRSGRFLETAAMRAGFALAAQEHLTCLLAIGTARDWPPAKPKPALEQVFSRW
jgi:nitroreductase